MLAESPMMNDIERRVRFEPRSRRIRLADGTDWQVARLPVRVTCSVCRQQVPVPQHKGHLLCAHCGTLVLSVL